MSRRSGCRLQRSRSPGRRALQGSRSPSTETRSTSRSPTSRRTSTSGSTPSQWTRPECAPFRWKKALADGDTETIDVTLHAQSKRIETPKWMFFGAAGVAVVSLGVATGLAADASSMSSSQKALNPLLRDSGTQGQISTLSTAANALFIGGGVLRSAPAHCSSRRGGAASRRGKSARPSTRGSDRDAAA